MPVCVHISVLLGSHLHKSSSPSFENSVCVCVCVLAISQFTIAHIKQPWSVW